MTSRYRYFTTPQNSLRVEVGMSRLPEEPVDAEMEAVHFDPNEENDDEDVFNESQKIAS